jgi:hypothetical protein
MCEHEKELVPWGKGKTGEQRFRFMCRECERSRVRQYKNHPGKREWDIRNRAKRVAHKIVESALISGKLVHSPCCCCGSNDSHAHHEDYSKPLEVVWLCPFHHSERHRELRSSPTRVEGGIQSSSTPSFLCIEEGAFVKERPDV